MKIKAVAKRVVNHLKPKFVVKSKIQHNLETENSKSVMAFTSERTLLGDTAEEIAEGIIENYTKRGFHRFA